MRADWRQELTVYPILIWERGEDSSVVTLLDAWLVQLFLKVIITIAGASLFRLLSEDVKYK